MYLYVNPPGTRHQLFDTFSRVIEVNFSDATYRFSILSTENIGKYDLLISHVTDRVSKNKYIKAEIVENEKNIYRLASSIEKLNQLFETFLGTPPPSPEEKRFQVLSLFPENILVNGYFLVGTKVPPSVLDNFEELTKTLDLFFAKEK